MLLFSAWFDSVATLQLLLSFLVHLVVLVILVFGIYYTTFRRKNFVFTFFLIGSIVFFLSYVMSKLDLNLGFAMVTKHGLSDPALGVSRSRV